MTSNIGAETIKRGGRLGFSYQRDEAAEAADAYEKMREKLMEQLKREFRPEFINRVDNIIVFRQLSQQDIVQIVDIVVQEVNDRLAEHELTVETTEAARLWLGEKGYDPEFGARPLRRLVQREVEDRLSDAVLSGVFKEGDTILVDVQNGQVVLVAKSSAEPMTIEEALPTLS